MKYYIRKNGKRTEVTKEEYFKLFPPVDVPPEEETENVSRETVEETKAETKKK